MKKKKEKQLFYEWLEKGNHDIENAIILFRNKGYTDTICFLCQQSAEKYLKGYLIRNKIEPPKIHSLAALIRLCIKLDKNFIDLVEDIKKLDKYYIDTRYPLGAPILYSAHETKLAIKIAENVINFILKKILGR